MTVGIPGVGFGGIFYLCTALAMPFKELARALRDRRTPNRWSLVARQSCMALAIIGAMWGTGWLLGQLITPHVRASSVAAGGAAVVPHNVLRVGALAITLGLLALLVLATRIAGVVLAMRGSIPKQTFTPMKIARGP